MRKAIIITVSLVVIISVGLCFSKHRKKRSDIASNTSATQTNDMTDLEQKVLSFTIDGRSPKGVKQWQLCGTSAEIMESEIHLDELQAVAYGEDVTINLTSDKGVYRKDAGEVELIGNVRVVSDDGLILTTDKAKWSQGTKEISTDTVVNIRKDGMIAIGTGGMANSEDKKARLDKDVTVIMEPNTKVESSGSLNVDYGENTAVFMDNVKVEDKDGHLFADKLTVNFSPETQKITEVIAEGNVKVKKGNSYTLSDKAIYTESTKSAKLLGRPRVIIDSGELSELNDLTEIAPEEKK